MSLPEKLAVIQLAEKLHALDGTLRFIMSFTYSPTAAYPEAVQHIPLGHTTIPLRSSLMLSSYLRMGFISDPVHSVSPAKILYEVRLSHAGYTPRTFSPPSFDQPTNSFWRLVTKYFYAPLVQFSLVSLVSVLILLRALQSMTNLGLFYNWSPLFPILWLSFPVSKAHCLRTFFN
jgi:hypothetical protein